jgi:hypothetical protein
VEGVLNLFLRRGVHSDQVLEAVKEYGSGEHSPDKDFWWHAVSLGNNGVELRPMQSMDLRVTLCMRVRTKAQVSSVGTMAKVKTRERSRYRFLNLRPVPGVEMLIPHRSLKRSQLLEPLFFVRVISAQSLEVDRTYNREGVRWIATLVLTLPFTRKRERERKSEEEPISSMGRVKPMGLSPTVSGQSMHAANSSGERSVRLSALNSYTGR